MKKFLFTVLMIIFIFNTGFSNRKYDNNLYYKDSYNVYYEGEKISGASAASFVVLSNGYARDNYYAYYRGNKISGSSGNSFKNLDNGYAKDNYSTYYKGKKVNNWYFK